MIRIGRLTDYGIVLLTHMAAEPERLHNAAELALDVRLPAPTVSKLLRILAREGLLQSQRGVKGGYGLAKSPNEVSVAEIIRALEGPIALTTCNSDTLKECKHEPVCPVRGPWHKINRAVCDALEGVRLSDMAAPRVALPLAHPTLPGKRRVDPTRRIHQTRTTQAAGLTRG
jgi:FeS assembly SUF system regulator